MKTTMMITAISTAAFILPASTLAQNASNDTAPAIELKVAQSIGLKQALQIAMTELEGKVVEAESDSFGGAQVYEVDILDGTTVREVKIDAQSGSILSVRGKRLNSLVNRLIEDDDMKAANSMNVSLLDYLVAVEEKTAGEVTEISLDSDDGRVYIEMTVFNDGMEQDVTVDPRTDSITMGDFD